MKEFLIIANWKMHKSVHQAQAFCRDFIALSRGIKKTRMVICPSFTALAAVQDVLQGTGVRLGAQDLFWAGEGPYTGEVSPGQLIDAGCSYVIVGHSERRQIIGETDEIVNTKLRAAQNNGLIPILCVGETLAERQNQQAKKIVQRQLSAALKDVSFDLSNLVIAYEPVWAIGTGINASYQDAVEMADFIRQCLGNLGSVETAGKIPVLYGGSVKADNFAEFLQGGLNGALVGGASLQADSFFAIVRLCENA